MITFHLFFPETDIHFNVSIPADKSIGDAYEILFPLMLNAIVEDIEQEKASFYCEKH